MNLLVMCAGRRVTLIQALKTEMNKLNGCVIAEDRDINAPAIYFADSYTISKNDGYMDLLRIIKENKIDAVICLHDVVQSWLSLQKDTLEKQGIKLIISDYETIQACTDKLMFWEKWHNELSICPTKIYKPKNGSASIGVEKIEQPFLVGTEYNVQVYFDTISGKIVDTFQQEKILMRAGETERSKTVWKENINTEIHKLEGHRFYGPVDIDMIEHEGKIYLIDINPRFGGGYPMAHASGVNFAKLLVNNIYGNENKVKQSDYKLNIPMMKYDVLYQGVL
jgi:carbamoyl-phosphate synthase large subunit